MRFSKLLITCFVLIIAIVAIFTIAPSSSIPTGFAWWNKALLPSKTTIPANTIPTDKYSVGDAIIIGKYMCMDQDGSITNIKKSLLRATTAEIKDISANRAIKTLADVCNAKRTDIIYEAYCSKNKDKLEVKYKTEFCPKNTKCINGKCA